MNTIKEVIEGKIDEIVHSKFTRYGKGTYERFLMEIKKGKDLKLKTSWDWSNDFFALIAENIKEEIEITGKIIANRDFESELPCPTINFTKRGKLYTAEFKTKVNPETLKKLYELFKFNFILLKLKASKFKLACGSSLPKPGGKIKDNFCRATFPLEFKDEFAWDVKEFKILKIVHEFNISDIIVPEEFKNDPTKARLKATRKGKLKRKLTIDDKEETKEYSFEA